MVDGFYMDKATAVVFLNVISNGKLPVSINTSSISNVRWQEIVATIISNHLIDSSNGVVRPDKGFDPFLIPMINAQAVVVYKRIDIDGAEFCVSVYPSPRGLSAIVDDMSEEVRFVRISSFDDLWLLLTPFSSVVKYIGLVLFEQDGTSIHTSEFDHRSNSVHFVGKRKGSNGNMEDQDLTVSVSEYKEMLISRLQEVCDAVSY